MSPEEYKYYEDKIEVEATYGFEDVEDAIFALYESLFDSESSIDNNHIYRALRFLIWKKGMNKVYQEITELDGDMIRVKHIINKES